MSAPVHARRRGNPSVAAVALNETRMPRRFARGYPMQPDTATHTDLDQRERVGVVLRNPFVCDAPAAMNIESRGSRRGDFHRTRHAEGSVSSGFAQLLSRLGAAASTAAQNATRSQIALQRYQRGFEHRLAMQFAADLEVAVHAVGGPIVLLIDTYEAMEGDWTTGPRHAVPVPAYGHQDGHTSS
jgi:hypothetical protein